MVINRAVLWNAGFAIVLILCAAVVIVDAGNLRVPFSFGSVGPTFLPYFVAVGLIACGLALIWQICSQRNVRESTLATIDRLPIVIISLGLVIQFTLIDILGWIVVAAVQFALVARAFQSTKAVQDFLVGLLLGGAIFFAFHYGLGLRLPAGTLFRSLGI